jgi:predicted ATPase/DNA-binding SARP family transcriptional activator
MSRLSPPSQSHQFRLNVLAAFRLEASAGGARSQDKFQSIDLPTRKIESLLAYLALHPEPHAREKLAALIWGDATDEQARNSLRNALSVLRKQLVDDLLLVDRETVQLAPRFPLWVDAVEFKRQADEFLAAPAANLDDVDLQLYPGDLLPDFYDEWILPERERYRLLHQEVLLRLTQIARAQSEYTRAIEFAQRVLRDDAANERAHQHLMFAHLASGNRAAALKQYEECRRALDTELSVEPMPETTALYRWIQQAAPESNRLEARLTNLPIPVSSFIGRKRESAEVKTLLATHRLVTLTGAGGSGKTRLAIQVATDLVDKYTNGVWWVELAPLMDELLVPQVAAKALGVREIANQPLSDTLTAWIGARQMLLVLDNCEHVVSTSARLAEKLLQACPQLVILATSREGLGIAGEVTWLVPLLSLPETEDWLRLFQDYEAIRLFSERARAAKSDFQLTEQNALAVAQICRRLDGIPLAIELAAARVKVLPAEDIAARLDDRFNLLTTGSRSALPRQQTLRALIDWSYDLLSPEEKTLFRRLAVFHGGRTLEAVEEVCSGDGIPKEQVLDLVARLVDKSLLLTEEQNGTIVYRMLDTIRHYAHDRLHESDEEERIRDRHANYFLQLAERAEPQLQGPGQLIWLNRLETERHNLRAALDWSLSDAPRVDGAARDRAAGLRLAGALYWFWIIRGPLSEGKRWLETALSENPAEQRDAARAKALCGLGEIAWDQSDMRTARRAYTESLDIWREVKDSWWVAFSVLCLGYVELNDDHFSEALELIEQSVTLARGIGDKSLLARTLRGLGNALMQTDIAKARSALEESVALSRQVGDKLRLAYTLDALGKIALSEQDDARAVALCGESVDLLREVSDRVNLAGPIHSLGQALLEQGDHEKAKELFTEGLVLAHQVNDRLLVALNVMGFAGVAMVRGRSKRAARLLAAGEALLSEIPSSVWHRYHVNYERHLKSIRDQLDISTFDAARMEGHALSEEEAIRFAMSDED